MLVQSLVLQNPEERCTVDSVMNLPYFSNGYKSPSQNVELQTLQLRLVILCIYFNTVPKISLQQECIPVGCVPPALYRTGLSVLCSFQGISLTETPPRTDPLPHWKEHWTRDRPPPPKEMGPGSHTGSDIIQRHPGQNDKHE